MLKRYSTVSDISETDVSSSQHRRDNHNTMDSISVASSHRRFKGHKRLSSELSEPLTMTSVVDESLGSSSQPACTGGDPYFVFRNDLQRKLELVDESLADFLRVVHETVRVVSFRVVCVAYDSEMQHDVAKYRYGILATVLTVPFFDFHHCRTLPLMYMNSKTPKSNSNDTLRLPNRP